MMTMDLALMPAPPPDASLPVPCTPAAKPSPSWSNEGPGRASAEERGSFQRLLRDATQAKEGAPAKQHQARGSSRRSGDNDRPVQAGPQKTPAREGEPPAGGQETPGTKAIPDQPARAEGDKSIPPATGGDAPTLTAEPSGLAQVPPELPRFEEGESAPGPAASVRLIELLRELGGPGAGNPPSEPIGALGRLLQAAGEGLGGHLGGGVATLPPAAEPAPAPGVAELASALSFEMPADGADEPTAGAGNPGRTDPGGASAVDPSGATPVLDPETQPTAIPARAAAAGASPFESAPRSDTAAAAEPGTPGQAVAAGQQLDSRMAHPQPVSTSPESSGSLLPPAAQAHPEKPSDGLREHRLVDPARASEASGEVADRVPDAQESDTGHRGGSGSPSGETIESPFARTEATASDDGAPPSHRFEIDMREARAQQNLEAGPGKTAEAHGAARDREVPAGALRAGVFEQIVQRSVAHVNGANGEIRIDLKPEYLGHVRMQILTENQQVTVRILTELPAVREMIENGLPQLKVDLQQQGLQVARLEVAVSDDHRQHPGRRAKNSGGRLPGAGDGVAGAGAASAAAAVATQYRGGRGGNAKIDMFI